MLHTGVEKNVIVESLKKEYGYTEVNEFDCFGKDALTVVGDSGFGVSRKIVYLYVKEKKDSIWQLVIYRATNSSKIEIKIDGDGIAAISKNGNKLFFVPKEGLSLSFDPKEQ